MEGSITHTGVVEKIEGRTAFVRIEQHSACASCRAASMCNASDKADKLIEATIREGRELSEGATVNIYAQSSLKPLAVFLAYLLPLFIMVAVLFAMHSAGLSDGMAALGSIGSAALYFIVLWLARGKLKRRFVFYVE